MRKSLIYIGCASFLFLLLSGPLAIIWGYLVRDPVGYRASSACVVRTLLYPHFYLASKWHTYLCYSYFMISIGLGQIDTKTPPYEESRDDNARGLP
jgi:hypothetical protein